MATNKLAASSFCRVRRVHSDAKLGYAAVQVGRYAAVKGWEGTTQFRGGSARRSSAREGCRSWWEGTPQCRGYTSECKGGGLRASVRCTLKSSSGYAPMNCNHALA